MTILFQHLLFNEPTYPAFDHTLKKATPSIEGDDLYLSETFKPSN